VPKEAGSILPTLLYSPLRELRTRDIWSFRRAGKASQAPMRHRFAANNSKAVLVITRACLCPALLAEWLVAEDLRSGRLKPLAK
jgi:DNA-binding transcriptional LysR family regulator